MNDLLPTAVAHIAPNGQLTPRQRRRLLIDMALRRARPGTGSSHAMMHQRTAMNDWPDLRDILQGFQWVIVGGVATRAYMPERFRHAHRDARTADEALPPPPPALEHMIERLAPEMPAAM